MKILVVADIHSNWPALAAIQEPFDLCLFVGDLVDYGTDPIRCIDWVRRHAMVSVRGNHDHAVAQRIPVKKDNGLHRLAAATRPLHWKLLTPLHMKYLTRLPVTRRITVDGKRFYLVHATPRDPFDEYLRDDRGAWKARLQGIDADLVLVGHSHVPFCLELDRLTVINPGSVGQPRDGDPRCAYAMIEDGRIELRRVKYDIDATLKHMRESGIDADTVDLAAAVLRSGGQLDVADLERWNRRGNGYSLGLFDDDVTEALRTERPPNDGIVSDTTLIGDLPPHADDVSDTVAIKLPPSVSGRNKVISKEEELP